MLKNTLIIVLLIALIYLYYQNRKLKVLPTNFSPDNFTETIFDGDWETKNSKVIKDLEKEVGELTTEKDELTRDNKTLEQETLALNNRLRNKQQEVSNKDKEITRLKKEKDEKEIALNKKITEKNKDLEELKKKYSSQGKLLDEEQTDNNKLGAKIESLETKITELEKTRTDLLKELATASQLTNFWDWLQEDETHQAGLKDWSQVINFLKTQQQNYYLVEGNWSEGWTKNNKDHYKVFQKWLKTKNSTNK